MSKLHIVFVRTEIVDVRAMKTDCCQILKPFGIAALLFALSAAGAQDYDVAAYVWPAYQPEPRWAELGIFKAGKGEWQSVWEASI